MPLHRFFFISALIPSICQAQHIATTQTKISFNDRKKTLLTWIQEDIDGEFGKTSIITTTTNKPPFVQTATINRLTVEDFNHIAAGFSFYCSGVKREKNISYGAIVINPNQHHFDEKTAQSICMHIRNAQVQEQLQKRAREISVELSND